MLTKQESLLGRGTQVKSSSQGTQENYSTMWLAVPGFLLMELVSRSYVAHHSDSGSFLVVQPR